MLTRSQVAHFETHGYLHVPDVVGDAELEMLHNATETLLNEAHKRSAATAEDIRFGALVGAHIGEGNHLCRIEYTFHKDWRFLELLGNPKLLEVAASLSTEPLVVTWEDMIVKMPNCGLRVPFHQDALHQSKGGTVFSVGVYLDDSHDDPLLAIPGTQHLGPLSERCVERIAVQRHAEVVELPVQAGDVLVHNVRMIHGSAANSGSVARRVIYIEFRTSDQILNDSPWDEHWLARRSRYIPYAIERRAKSPISAGESDLEILIAGRAKPLFPEIASAQTGPLDLRVHHMQFARQ